MAKHVLLCTSFHDKAEKIYLKARNLKAHQSKNIWNSIFSSIYCK